MFNKLNILRDKNFVRLDVVPSIPLNMRVKSKKKTFNDPKIKLRLTRNKIGGIT